MVSGLTDSSAGLGSCQVDDWSPGVLFTTLPCHAIHTATHPGVRHIPCTDPRGPFARFPDWAEMGSPGYLRGPCHTLARNSLHSFHFNSLNKSSPKYVIGG